MSENYVELDRTFHRSVADGAKTDIVDLTQRFGLSEKLGWDDLLALPRVVILSGGGSGKTTEIRHRARLLHDAGRPSFFLRIEYVREDFAGAFDRTAGTHEQFQEWAKSGDEGWIFLDSVDEARLKSSEEFERAIVAIGRQLQAVLARAHIVVTGREAAWRPRADRQLIRANLPYETDSASDGVPRPDQARPDAERAADQYFDPGDADDTDDLDGQAATAPAQDSSKARETNSVLIVGLDELNSAQIETFARAKGVTDVVQFMRALERKEAQQEAARPLDLEGLVDYWNAHKTIGSQFELTDAIITKRLAEVDADRADKVTFTREQLRQAARTLATANLLMQSPEIRQQDAPSEIPGVEPADVLNWNERDVRALLTKPLFVASQFGAVRIFVQKAREYLTAEWLHKRLIDHASRVKIEGLFFRVSYGQQVIVPSMRGVLPWLALLDDQILARVRSIAPEVMFEGGDPSRLPTAVRKELLTQACKQLATNPGRRALTDFQPVQRFAAPDLSDLINGLFDEYREEDEVFYFLTRMVWQGEIVESLPAVARLAACSRHFNVRFIAIRAVGTLGGATEISAMCESLISGSLPPDREWVAEAIEFLPHDARGLAWLIKACSRVKAEQRYSYDPLPRAIRTYLARLPLALLPSAMAELQLLVAPGDRTESDEERNAQPFDWLAKASVGALARLIDAKHATAFDSPTTELLKRIVAANRSSDSDTRDDTKNLAERIAAWPEFNHALFWSDVRSARARRFEKSKEPLTDVWGVGLFGRLWSVAADDFNYFVEQAREQPLLDDRKVALSLAHSLYRENEKPKGWLKLLKGAVEHCSELQVALASLLGPPSDQVKKWRRQEARWKVRSVRQAEKRDAEADKWREYLQANAESLRTPFPGGGLRESQRYLSSRMREFDKKHSRWTEGRWRSLIPEFGGEVARAFHDGAIAYWRSNVPRLHSEAAVSNSTPFSTIFGLTGLLFESREHRKWPERLTAGEAELATRYAVHELNGFPPWLPGLFAVHPESVGKVILEEIAFELRAATAADAVSHGVLADVSGVGVWLWSFLAPALVDLLADPPKSTAHLRQTLEILRGSLLSDDEIKKLASTNATTSDGELSSLWFGAWIGVDPESAIPALSARLQTLSDKEAQTQFAMRSLISIAGGRHGRGVARDAYRTAAHLTELFLLMHRYILESEDIDRLGKGVFSPGLRDDAQEARDALMAPLRDMPGPDSYAALQRIATEHPSERGRAWAKVLAHERATADSNPPGLTATQAREFLEELERTPRTGEELHSLAIDRLLDYKHYLEDGETSTAGLLIGHEETIIRNAIADWCKFRGAGKYTIAQEEEFADRKRTDFRFHTPLVSSPVTVELKLANKWTGAELVERLENQLCRDYMRDNHSSRGIYLLMDQGGIPCWDLPDGTRVYSVDALGAALQEHWDSVSAKFPQVDALRVIAIDLPSRAKPVRPAGSMPVKKRTKRTRAAE